MPFVILHVYVKQLLEEQVKTVLVFSEITRLERGYRLV